MLLLIFFSYDLNRPLTEITFVPDSTADNTLLVSAAHGKNFVLIGLPCIRLIINPTLLVDKLPQVRNGETGDWIGTFSGHKGAVWSTKIDRLTRTLAVTASGDFSAKLWCATTGKELHEYKHKHVVKSVDFSNDTGRFATGCQDGVLRVYDTCVPDAAPLQFNHSNDPARADPITRVHWGSKENNSTVLIGRRSGFVELWDVRCPSGEEAGRKPAALRQLEAGNQIIDMELGGSSASTDMLVATAKQVSVLNTELAVVRSYTMPENMNFKEEGGVSLHPDGKTFMAGASDLWLREFDVESGEVLRTFKGHHGPIRTVRYHPSGKMVASGSEDATIRLWTV